MDQDLEPGFLDELIAEVQGETSVDPSETENVEEAPAPEQQQTEGPGNLKVALKEARAETKAEKSARKALEEELATLRSQVNTFQNMFGSLGEDSSDPLDPDAYSALKNQIKAVQSQAMEQVQLTRVEISREFARQQYSDYDDVAASLRPYVESGLINLDAILASANPAQMTYKLGKMLQGEAEVGEAKVREDERKKVLAELSGKAKSGGRAPVTLRNAPNAKGIDNSQADDPEDSWG